MYFKYKGFRCDCGEWVAPTFNELHFQMIKGEILNNLTDDFECENCKAVYRLDNIEMTPDFIKVNKEE